MKVKMGSHTLRWKGGERPWVHVRNRIKLAGTSLSLGSRDDSRVVHFPKRHGLGSKLLLIRGGQGRQWPAP